MKLIAIQDLKQPRRLKERLRAEKELLLTSDGRPVAVLVNVEASEDPDTMIQSIRDSRSRLALSRVRESAARSGACPAYAGGMRMAVSVEATRRSSSLCSESPGTTAKRPLASSMRAPASVSKRNLVTRLPASGP